MRRSFLRILFLVLLLGAALPGCKKNVGTPEDNAVVEEEEEAEEEEKEFLFGYSGINLENPYYKTLQLSLENTLGEEGYTLISSDPVSDADLQEQQIRELIEAGIDVLFLCPVDWEAITPALEELKEANVSVVNIDSQVKETDLVKAFVGSDNKNAGFICGEDLKKKCPDGGRIVILECPSMNAVNERITGFEQAIADAGFEVLGRVDVNGEKEKAKETMLEFLAAYPEIDAVMCGNDHVSLGALEAVEETGREGIKIYGVDGSPDVKKELTKPDSSMTATGAQSPIRIGKKAAEIGIAIINGENFEQNTYEDTFLIDKGNVKMYGTDGWQ